MLPAAADDLLRSELGILVTTGSRLPDLPQRQGQVPLLMYLARDKPGDSFHQAAVRLLSLLDRSLRDCADSPDEEALLTDEESLGLRILFGLHPDYRDSSTMVRRENAAEYLIHKAMAGDSFYRSHESAWLQTTVVCLRTSYGQESGASPSEYESVNRRTFASIGPRRRIEAVEVRNLARSRIDGLDSVGMFIHPSDRQHLEQVVFERLDDFPPPEAETLPNGSYRVDLSLQPALSIGQEIEWGFRRRYTYKQDIPFPTEDRFSVTTMNGGFDACIGIGFEADTPATIWRYSESIQRQPGEPTAERLVELIDSKAEYRVYSNETEDRWAYGLAWRWD
jgi:hypothetical protein